MPIIVPVVLLFPIVLFFMISRTATFQSTIKTLFSYPVKLKKLKQLAEINTSPSPGFCAKMRVYYTCLILIFTHLYMTAFQYLNKSIVKINKNTYELTYFLNGNTYKMFIKTNLGPQPKIIQALDSADDDITDKLRPYLGPGGNFHGLKYKPKDFNITSLTLNMGDTRELAFSQNDEINLSPPLETVGEQLD